MRKKILSSVLTIIVASQFMFLNVIAFAKTDNKRVHGSVHLKYLFQKSETNQVYNWLNHAKVTGEKYIEDQISTTTDSDKLKLLKKELSESKNFNVKELLKTNEDGSSTIDIKLPNCKIVVDDTAQVTSDANGDYSLDSVTVGEHKVDLYYQGNQFNSAKIDITSDNFDNSKSKDTTKETDVTVTSTSKQINDAINRMGESMVHAQSIILPSYFGYYTSDFGQFDNLYNRRYDNFPSTGNGLNGYGLNMWFATPSGIVGCNKADTTLNSAQNFPNDVNSDCALSIGYGIIALGNPIYEAIYYDSEKCAVEAVQNKSMNTLGTNVYCNGKLGSDGHYNCSWFNGIGHDERMHIHDDHSYTYAGFLDFKTHISNIGWGPTLRSGSTSGYLGSPQQLEAVSMSVVLNSAVYVNYSAHVQDIGWMGTVSNGATAGTTGQSKRLEAIKIWLTGSDSSLYNVNYKVYVDGVGWISGSNGSIAGTVGQARRIEAIEISYSMK
ncbi:hypothetical protein [Clostridium sp. C8-1-8]|uniref:hypothetical protein n=1 Tax=Clostridium sp. C8-1-8 TaxID=2698831 RepID=UPI00136C716C|nr:hypothetical protein [Clostridium sp. C8-1-8]